MTGQDNILWQGCLEAYWIVLLMPPVKSRGASALIISLQAAAPQYRASRLWRCHGSQQH